MSQTQRTIAWAMLPVGLLAAVHFWLATRATLFAGFADIDVFLYSVWHFRLGGPLYNMAEPLQATFAAGRSVFKFPPLYVAGYLPWVDAGGIHPGVYRFLYIGQVLRYGLTAGLVCLFLGPRRNPLWWLVVVILFAVAAPYYEVLHGLTFDNLFLFLVVAAVICVKQGRDVVAGILLACATVLKIYPFWLMICFVAERNWKAMAWFMASLLLLLLCGLVLFGMANNEDYFLHILPVLFNERVSCDVGNQAIWSLSCRNHATTSDLGWIVLLVTVLVSVYFLHYTVDAPRKREQLLCFMIAAMLVYMKNVWGNYQLVLLVPIAILVASAIESDSRWRYGNLLVALLAWLPLLFSDNYSVLDLPHRALLDSSMNRFVIDHLRPLSAFLLWAWFSILMLFGSNNHLRNTSRPRASASSNT